MGAFPETGRLAGHVLLDAVTAYDPDEPYDPTISPNAPDLAFQRLAEIPGAFDANVSEVGDDTTVQLNLSNVLGPALVLINRAAALLAEQRGVEREVIISELREYLDR